MIRIAAVVAALVIAGCAGPGPEAPSDDPVPATQPDKTHGATPEGGTGTPTSPGGTEDGPPGGQETTGTAPEDPEDDRTNEESAEGNATPSPSPAYTGEPEEASGGSTDPDDPGPEEKRAPVTWNITIGDHAFKGGDLTIQVHDEVRWVHEDGGTPHTVTEETYEFDSGTLSDGDVFVHGFDLSGRFPYLCEFHPSMEGTIVVRETYNGTP